MPALFVFLFKVNVALLLFCAGYYLVLRHLTFYTLNRVYLMAAIIFATLYPKIDLSGFAQRHETLAKPVQNVVLNWQAPAQIFIKPLNQPNYWQWATVVFWAGAIFLAFRLMMQLFSLFQLYRRSKPGRIHEHDVRLIDGEAAPFSFWRSIYVNPANHNPADLQAILLHEQVHVNGWHTIDILLAELSSIFYWFNPGIWLMKKAVRENIEFITDRKILNKGFDSKTYQYSLVNVSFSATTPGIVNHFNISTIKKRIIMMNAKRSSRFTLTRYAFVIPAVVALLLVFTLSKADIAKPITHKIAVAIKPVTLAIAEVTHNAIALTDTAPVKNVKLAPVKTLKTDTVKKQTLTLSFNSATIHTDTGKKATVFISSPSNSIDSMNIVLNGKKVDNAIFSHVDPSTISSINIVGVNDVKRMLDVNKDYTFDNNRNIIFINTKGSELGKELADKLGSNRQLTKVRINGAAQNAKSLTLKEGELISNLPLKGNVSNVRIISGSNMSTLSAEQVKEIALDSGAVRINGYQSKGITGFDYKLKNNGGNTNTLALTSTNTNKDVVVVNGYRTNTNFVYNINTTNRISDKLVVIDGKVASEKELKKLSAFDIDRMTTSNGASTDTLKKYGDKAKNGVVYIYTKKSK